jgi:hypothetical protein
MREKLDPTVYCRDCTGLNRGATRERARQHVAATGHIVSYIIEDVTVYRPLDES